ncbi:MAG: hypothetical protein ACE5FT_07705 [Candidatus Nanoarchaeia archaeon]
MKKRVPLKPTWKETVLSWIYTISCWTVWTFLLIGVIHLISYYIYVIRNLGFYNEESIRICIYIIGGAFAFLFIYKDKASEIFKVRK